jgi:hypothetical protein
MISRLHHACAIALLAALMACGGRRDATPPSSDSARQAERPAEGTSPSAPGRPGDRHDTITIVRDTVHDTVMRAPSPFELNPLIAGERVGKITIGEDIESVNRTLGRSDSGDAAMGHAWQFWFAKGSRAGRTMLGIYSVLNDSATHHEVREILVTSDRFVTAGKIGVGSSLDAIMKAYPGIALAATYKSPAAGGKVRVYDAIERGIAFEIIPAATGSGRCIAVIIHRKGDNVTREYLPWKG